MIRVLICDDHQIVRQGIKQILADASDLALAGEAASGPEAIARVRAGGIDVVLMDIAMPQRDGVAASRVGVHRRFDRLDALRAVAMRSEAEGAVEVVTSAAWAKPVNRARANRMGLIDMESPEKVLVGAVRRPGVPEQP